MLTNEELWAFVRTLPRPDGVDARSTFQSLYEAFLVAPVDQEPVIGAWLAVRLPDHLLMVGNWEFLAEYMDTLPNVLHPFILRRALRLLETITDIPALDLRFRIAKSGALEPLFRARFAEIVADIDNIDSLPEISYPAWDYIVFEKFGELLPNKLRSFTSEAELQQWYRGLSPDLQPLVVMAIGALPKKI